MTSQPSPTMVRLIRRAAQLGVPIEPPVAVMASAYYDLLQRWNEKINLTSLEDSDEALERLLLEPLAAAAFLPRGIRLVDIGSGGGSPALPLALATGASHLTMIESRGRKAAFLREALRTLEVSGTVESDRVEALSARVDIALKADIVSIRAVRVSSALASSASSLLASQGQLAFFGRESSPVFPGFEQLETRSLLPQTFLHLFRKSR